MKSLILSVWLFTEAIGNLMVILITEANFMPGQVSLGM
jgi:dipeptide/tripeptide permease